MRWRRFLHVVSPAGAYGDSAGLALGALVAFALHVGGAGLKYVSGVLFARWMGPDEFGGYSYAFTWAALLANVGALGLTTGVVRFVPQYIAEADRPRLTGLLTRSRQITLLASVAAAGLAAGLLGVLTPGPSLRPATLAIALALTPLLAQVNLHTEALRGAGRMALAYAPPMIVQPAVALALTWGAWRYAGELDNTVTLSALGVAATVGLLAQALCLGRALPPGTLKTPPLYETRHWMRVCLPMLLMTCLYLVFSYADILLVGLLTRNAADVGLYAAASRTAGLVGFVLIGVSAMAMPRISAAHAAGDRPALQRILGSASLLSLAPSLAIAAALAWWARPILGLFGPDFVQAHSALLVMIAGQVVSAAAGPVAFVPAMAGQEKPAVAVYALAAGLSLGLGLGLIPIAGILGAAIANACSLVAWNVLLCVLIRRRLGVTPSVLGCWR